MVFDDFKALAYEDCSKFRNSRKLSALLAALRNGLSCVVADIDFCDDASPSGMRYLAEYFLMQSKSC